MTGVRITLDSNQLVRALMRPPQLATFIMAWESRRFTVICSSELLDEYERVLQYPAIADRIYPDLLRAFRQHLIYDLEMVQLTTILRVCRDADDDKVIATALQGQVDCLLTADEDLRTDAVVAILQEAGIRVMTMNDFITLLDAPPPPSTA